MTPERTGLTPATRNCFNAIEAHITRHGCSPSFEEIKLAIGVNSKGFVHRLVTDLVSRGWITYTPGKKCSIVIVPAPAAPLQLPAALETALKRYCANSGALPNAVIAGAVARLIGFSELDKAA
jgi:repressor LexA